MAAWRARVEWLGASLTPMPITLLRNRQSIHSFDVNECTVYKKLAIIVAYVGTHMPKMA